MPDGEPFTKFVTLIAPVVPPGWPHTNGNRNTIAFTPDEPITMLRFATPPYGDQVAALTRACEFLDLQPIIVE